MNKLNEIINVYKNLNIKQTAVDYALLCNKATYEIEKINTANNGLFRYSEDLLTYAKTHDVATVKNIIKENVEQLKNTLGKIGVDYEDKARFVDLLCSTVIKSNNKYTQILNDMQNEKEIVSEQDKKEEKEKTDKQIKEDKNKNVENVILEEGEKCQPEFEHLASNVKNENQVNNTHLNYVKDNLDSLIFVLGSKAEEELGRGGSEFVDDIINEIRNCNSQIDNIQNTTNKIQRQYSGTLDNLKVFISTYVNSYFNQKKIQKEKTTEQNEPVKTEVENLKTEIKSPSNEKSENFEKK